MPRTLAIAGMAAAVLLAAVLSVVVTDWLVMAGLWPAW